MKRLSALFAAAALALCFSVGQAAAMEGGSGAGQEAGQSAGSGQSAGGDSGAYQSGASNSAGSIRVLSPGDNGSVTQSNSTTAGAIAANLNKTDQSTTQSQSGGSGSDYAQIAGQEATNDQHADADATAKQLGAKNDALSIRVLSPGDSGNVTQSNSASAGALAANGNKTDQTVDQTQGGGYGSNYAQIAGQEAKNRQSADANAKAVQVKPSNNATSIRVLSPGDDGDVTQSNDATALSAALNGNETNQSIDQSQGAAPMEDAKADEGNEKKAYPSGSDYTQIAGQSADNHQSADADATAVQIKPSNTASSIRVLSPGDDGDVTQSNDATAVGIAANANTTDQSTTQSQSGSGSGSDYAQIAGQEAGNDQWADADATAVQVEPSNTASSIRVLSPGDDGDVTQSNSTAALGAALNVNETDQSLDQQQGGDGYGSDYLQVAGQGAWSDQGADADATAVQKGAKNEYTPVRVGSKNGKGHKSKDNKSKDEKESGGGGSVEQSNSVGALAIALNLNATHQRLEQMQTGHGSGYLQVGGQGSWSKQHGSSDAFGLQGGMRSKN
jgi:hypothetical protein